MTSNQIAYANSQIADRAEQETERHNRAMEEVQTKLAVVEELKAQTDYRYKQEMLNIEERKLTLQDEWNKGNIATKEQYNQMWEQIESWKANIQQNYTEQSLNINEQLAEYKRREVELEDYYKHEMVRLDEWKANLGYKEMQYREINELAQTLIRNETELLKAKLHGIPSIVASTLLDTLGIKDFSLQGVFDGIRGLIEKDVDTGKTLLDSLIDDAPSRKIGGSIPLTAPAIKENTMRNMNRSTSKYYFRGRPVE